MSSRARSFAALPPSTRAALAACGVAAVALAPSLVGCQLFRSDTGGAVSPLYPEPLKVSKTLDIQVIRDVTEIQLTNTTARSFGPSTLWINQRFARPIAGLAVGQTLRLSLRDFTDSYGDIFRAGGFFATEKPDRVAQVNLQTTAPDGSDEMLALIVVAGGEGE